MDIEEKLATLESIGEQLKPRAGWVAKALGLSGLTVLVAASGLPQPFQGLLSAPAVFTLGGAVWAWQETSVGACETCAVVLRTDPEYCPQCGAADPVARDDDGDSLDADRVEPAVGGE
ncbi:hypothetical protein [Halostella sp. PRR32]|uniref:hypothetical protein n=1 Tax=Halostella sp. PRR32 TaxID=3098147 RepID=UPI002B1D8F2A|nr:hypothetical protein [Halostella sp. PRR32]